MVFYTFSIPSRYSIMLFNDEDMTHVSITMLHYSASHTPLDIMMDAFRQFSQFIDLLPSRLLFFL